MTDTMKLSPPLCVIRREVAEHFAAIDRAARDFRVSRAGLRSVQQPLLRRLDEAHQRLQSAQCAAVEPVRSTAESADDSEASVFDVTTNAGTPFAALRARPPKKKAVTSTVSPRRPRLRLYSPTSPV